MNLKKTRFHSAIGIRHSAFTLVELLVVIGIIAVLISILFPVIGKIREAARETDTRALITSIEAACQSYQQDFHAFPGPLANSYVCAPNQTTYELAMPFGWSTNDTGITDATAGTVMAPSSFNDGAAGVDGKVSPGARVTEAENLVLGLLGGIRVNKTRAGNFFMEYDANAVGKGPASLNPVRPGVTGARMQNASLSSGKFKSGDGPDLNPSKDSIIPEFVDRWPEPMPILVLRARQGGKAFLGVPYTYPAYANENNDVVVSAAHDLNDSAQPIRALNGQYNLLEVTPYTQSSIGIGHRLKPSDYIGAAYDAMLPHGLASVDVTKGLNKGNAPEYNYPLDAFTYLADPSTYTMSDLPAIKKAKMRARKIDGIILISAGKDRVYGTADDVTNFGSVLP